MPPLGVQPNGQPGRVNSNFNLSFNNSFNTSFATNMNAGDTSNPSPEKIAAIQANLVTKPEEMRGNPTVTLSANTTNEAGKNLISHGPLTIDLTDLEKHL